MKCSVCAQDVPEDRYSDHLESEHGVTDDPTAVLIQHLTGLRSRAGEGDGDEELPDEEPSDADAFEEFLAASPAKSPQADEEEAHEAEQDEAEPDEEEEPDEAPAPVGGTEHEPESDGDADTAEDEGAELTDEDEAEFERMLAVYPEVDLRKGKPEPAAAPAPDKVAAGAVATEAAADADDKTFAIWDQAQDAPAAPPAADGDVLVVAPPAELERARRRRQAALLGLGAVIILIAVAVIYLLTRDTSTNKTTATAPLPTTATTVSPTFLPGPQGGAPTTLTPLTQPAALPATTVPATPATTAAPPTTAAPSADPGSKLVFSYTGAVCTPSGSLSVSGSITNTNSATYTFSYTIVLLRSDGSQQGTATGQVSHLPPGGRFGPGTIGTGSCTYPLASGPNPRQQITSITPG
jgi:hypothetical protein